jgi:hypothetical protein
MSLDEEVRARVEQVIDDHLKDPIGIEDYYKGILIAQGIEPNLETILAFIAGNFLGLANALYIVKFMRRMNNEEKNAFIELMKRRAYELREAFMLARVGST